MAQKILYMWTINHKMNERSLNRAEVEQLEKELEENPYNIRALSELAQWFASQGDYTSACQHYEKIVRVDEENGKAWTALGHCYLLKGEYQKCFTAYQKALYTMEDNRDPQLWYGIGLLYNKFESYEYAEPAYQAVLRIDPNFEQKHEVLYKLGLIYKKTKNFENAITYLRNSMACESIPISRKIDALCHIGNCYEHQEKMDDAIEIYKEAIALDENNFKTMEFLSWAYIQSQNHNDALELLKKALEYVTENCAEAGDIYYLMGRCYLDMTKYREGQSAFQKAIYKNPNAYIYWCSIGILYALALQPQDAFDCFVKASNISAESGDVWMNMAVLYERCGQKQEAALAYQRAYNLDNNNKKALERKTRLQAGEDTPQPPEFTHPYFEVSDIPFSIKKNEKSLKPIKSLPDINKFKQEANPEESKTRNEENTPSSNSSQQESEAESVADSSRDEPYLPPEETTPKPPSPRPQSPKAPPKTYVQPKTEPAPSLQSVPNTNYTAPKSFSTSSNLSNLFPAPSTGNASVQPKAQFPPQSSINSGPPQFSGVFNPGSSQPASAPQACQPQTSQPNFQNLGGFPFAFPGAPSGGNSGMPNMPPGMPNMTSGMPNMPSGMPNMPSGMPNMPSGMPNMPSGMPSNMGSMPPTMPPNMQGIPPQMMPHNMTGMPMMPNMHTGGMPSNPQASQGQSPQSQMSHYQMAALQYMMMNPMMMQMMQQMNPMANYMQQMRMMAARQQQMGQPKREQDSELAEALAHMNENEDSEEESDDTEDYTRRRRPSYKDTTKKRRKKK